MTALWYASRATGEVALLFLTAVLALGVLSAARVGGRRVPRFVIAGLHRNLTLAGLGFLAVHIMTTILDSFAPIGVLDVIVPFGSAYRPIWLGLGALAFDTLLVLTATSLLRARLGHRPWRALHWAAYACWLAAIVHALGTGSDTRTSLFLVLAGICGAVALTGVAWRIAVGDPRHVRVRVGAGVLAVLATVAVVAWAARGPLAPGWARRAGTPASLLGPAPTATPSDADPSHVAPVPAETRVTRGHDDDDEEREDGE